MITPHKSRHVGSLDNPKRNGPLKATILFYNLGGYHLARLASAKTALDAAGIKLNAIEITSDTSEHPWGELSRPSYVRTLSKFRDGDQPTVGDPEALLCALEEANPDFIAIPGWGYDFSRITIKWGRQNNKRLVLMSESKKDDAPRNFVKEAVKKHFWVNKFDSAIVGGQKHVDYLVDLGMRREKIFTGYDVVDNGFFASEVVKIQEQWSKSGQPDTFPKNKFFLSANRFIPRKNLPRLIECFAAAVTSGKMKEDWDLVLLGGGTDEQTNLIRSTAEQFEIGKRIHCPGFVTYDKICDWYAAASAFVHPALSEQWGLVVNEAMAAGLPLLLSSACGCHPELIDEGVNGFAFDPRSTDELTKKIVKMSNSNLDELGKNSAIKIQNKFSPDSFGRGLVAAIEAMSNPGK